MAGTHELEEKDRALLGRLAQGDTFAQAAAALGYGPDWATWRSRLIRRNLGVPTIKEAVRAFMAENDEPGVSRDDFDRLTELVESLQDAFKRRDAASTQPEQREARVEIRDREWDLKDHAKALGLSLADVEKLKDEKDYLKFKKMQERLRLEQEEELAEVENEENGTLGERIRDGLGGIKHKAEKP